MKYSVDTTGQKSCLAKDVWLKEIFYTFILRGGRLSIRIFQPVRGETIYKFFADICESVICKKRVCKKYWELDRIGLESISYFENFRFPENFEGLVAKCEKIPSRDNYGRDKLREIQIYSPPIIDSKFNFDLVGSCVRKVHKSRRTFSY